MLASVVLMVFFWAPTEGQMNQVTLGCELQLFDRSGGSIGLAFNLQNGTGDPVTVSYLEPFLDFSLTAMADDGEVQISKPPYDSIAGPAMHTLQGGETLRVVTPVTLRFDPGVPDSGEVDQFLWTLQHDPAPMELQATARVDGATVEPCSAHLEPPAM